MPIKEPLKEKPMAKVLVVDDREEDIYIFKNFLNLFGANSGVSIVEASTGEEAVRKAHEEHPDLIVMDIKMETNDAGFRAIREMRSDPALVDTPIWLVSSYAIQDEMHQETYPDVNFDDIIPRPFDQVALLKKVAATLSLEIPQKTKSKMGIS